MGKLRVLSAQQVCTILFKHGFVAVRQRGSHIVVQRKTETSTITVPIPNHKEIRIGTLKSIIRQSGVAASEFEQ